MTTVINIKELAAVPAVIIVDENDVKHEMKSATVQTFIDNVKLVESMGTNVSAVDEMEAMIKIILGAFPTLTEEGVRGWPLEVLSNISDLARGQNGEIVTTDEDKAAEAAASGNG